MSNLIVVCDDSYPGRIYYCKSLLHTVDRIYHANLCSYVEILRGIVDFMPSNIDFVFARCIVGGQDCILSCQKHIILILQNKAHFRCTPEQSDDLIVPELGKRFCYGCVSHYLNKTLDIF